MTQNAIDSNIPIEISKGGTNATSFSTATGVVKYDSTRLVTSTAATISATNVWQNTSQPAFQARLVNSTANDKTGTGTIYKPLFDTVTFDQATNYSTITGEFTAPVTGQYFLRSRVTFANVSIGTTFSLGIKTSNRDYFSQFGVLNLIAFRPNGSEFCDMDVADVAYVNVSVTGEAADTVGLTGVASNCDTYFTGYLVC